MTMKSNTIKDETMRLLHEYAKHRSTVIENEIIRLNGSIITFVVARYRPFGMEFDDAYQEAAIGMLRAIRKFDLSRNTLFSTYAVLHMKGALTHITRANNADRRTGSVVPMSTPIYDKITIADVLPTFELGFKRVELAEIVSIAISQLPERYQPVIGMCLRGYRQQDIAANAGVSQVQVSRIFKRFKSLMNTQMAEVS